MRRLGTILLAGVVAGVGLRYYIESRARAQETKAPPRLIDWTQARKVAISVAQSEQAPLYNRPQRQEQYTRLVKLSEPLIAEYLQVSLPQPITQVNVFDRREWLEANFTSFEQLFQPIEDLYHQNHTQNFFTLMFGNLNSQIIGAQIGGILGFLGRRVLGQYDLSLLSPDPAARGALYYVEPNIARVQTQLGLNDEDFRLWIALHETTHAFEFEAYPWVRSHFNAMLQRYFDQMGSQLETLGSGLPRLLGQAVQQWDKDRHWIEVMLTPEQRQLFEEIQALMSLVEGYSNHIMNAIGRTLLPTFDQIEQRMSQRQQSRTLFEQLFFRITGLDLKLAQYQQGEKFVNAIVEQRGIAFASRVWERAEHLPTLTEIRNPQQWIARMDRTS
jgi:coenzyme F420 biosynthesis associated uncharacterized protein